MPAPPATRSLVAAHLAAAGLAPTRLPPRVPRLRHNLPPPTRAPSQCSPKSPPTYKCFRPSPTAARAPHTLRDTASQTHSRISSAKLLAVHSAARPPPAKTPPRTPRRAVELPRPSFSTMRKAPRPAPYACPARTPAARNHTGPRPF